VAFLRSARALRSPFHVTSRYACAGTIALTLAAMDLGACSVRVGSGGPPPPGDKAKGEVFGVSACARTGNETKIAFGAGAQSFAFAWDTDHYVVVYPDLSSGDILAGKLAGDGSAIGQPVDIQEAHVPGDLPSLLTISNGYVVVWEEGVAGNVVYARALDPSASPVDHGIAVATTRLPQSRPVVAHAPGGNLAVAWMDQFDDGSLGVQVALITPSPLQVKATGRVATPDIAGWPWIAGDDGTLAIVWRDQATASNGVPSYDIPFATLDVQQVTASAQTSLRGSGKTEANLPRMIRTSAGFLAAWEDRRASDNEIFMALVDPSGGPMGGGLVEEPNSGDANWPNMAWTAQTAAIVYYQWRDARPQVFMSLVDETGARVGHLHDLQVSNGTGGWSKYPDVVWTGSEFGVMYVDTREGSPALWFQRVACRG
jgi:hypothetical protein